MIIGIPENFSGEALHVGLSEAAKSETAARLQPVPRSHREIPLS